MRVFIIGASGFLGSMLFNELSQQGYSVSGSYFSRPSHDLVYLDVCDRARITKVYERIRPDILIDCGGITRPDICEKEQERAYRVNVIGVTNLMEICNCKIIYFSTDYVFDGSKGHYIETDQPNPINYYGQTKLEAEKIVLSKNENSVVRISGLYGYSRQNNEFLDSLSSPVIYRASDCYSSNLLVDDILRYLPVFWSESGLFHLTDRRQLSRFEFSLKAVNILRLPTKVVAKLANELYPIARRPANSSLSSVHAQLLVKSEEEGLSDLRSRLTIECSKRGVYAKS